ncbi:MAG: hypothetical protein WCG83_02900 [Candidatus Peregrinibacteria bacterium]
MPSQKKKTSGPRWTIQKAVKVITQEIVDVRRELKEDIYSLEQKLTHKIDSLASDVSTLKSTVSTLRLEVHQNHVAFIQNHDELEGRVTMLETARVQ